MKEREITGVKVTKSILGVLSRDLWLEQSDILLLIEALHSEDIHQGSLAVSLCRLARLGRIETRWVRWFSGRKGRTSRMQYRACFSGESKHERFSGAEQFPVAEAGEVGQPL